LLDTLRMIDVTRAVLADAAEIDGPFLRTLDAVHLVAASRIRGSLTAFVTYDKKLATAAQQAGLPVLSPG
jgi:predicted nucleic acid-binding protein